MVIRNALMVIRTVLVLIYALGLAALVPAFFFNYGSRLFHRLAELWPLHH